MPIILDQLDLDSVSSSTVDFENLDITHVKVDENDVMLSQFRASLCNNKTISTLTKQLEASTPETRPKNFKKILRKQKDRKIACDLGAHYIDSQFNKICEKIVPVIESIIPNYLSSYKVDIIKFVKREVCGTHSEMHARQ